MYNIMKYEVSVMFDIEQYFDENEQPLDKIPSDGGFTGIFRSIACVGDSLSSGEYELVTPDGVRHYLDMFDNSWGQHLARIAGTTVYNFSRGGMTAREYVEGYGSAMAFWEQSKAAQAYIIALGCNDLFGLKEEVGSLDDIHDDDPSKNADTFAGWMGRLIARYKEIAPDAKFFLMTMPLESPDQDELRLKQGKLMYALAEHYSNTCVLDMAKYMPRYDEKFHERFFLEGHLNPAGYLLTGKIVAAYIDYIIRHNLKDFEHVGFINKEFSDSNVKKMYTL